MQKIILVLVLFLIPTQIHSQQQTTSEKIESVLSLIEPNDSFLGSEVQTILREILKMAVEEIQLTATETADAVEKSVRDKLIPIIEEERSAKNVWMVVGISGICTTVALILVFAFTK